MMSGMLVLVCLMIGVLCAHAFTYCPHNDAEVVEFSTPEPATLVLGCYRESVQLLCCINQPPSSSVEITWFKKKRKDDESWEVYNYSTVHFLEEKQVINIVRSEENDNGYYMCQAKAEGHLELVIHLRLSECGDLKAKPIIIVEPPIEHAVIGEQNRSLTCMAICGSDATTTYCDDIAWRRVYDKDHKKLYEEHTINSTEDSPYTIPKKRGEKYTMQVNLMFPRVQSEHFGLYECSVFSRYGIAYANVILQKQETPPEPGPIVGGIFGGLVGIGVVAAVLYTQWDRVMLVKQLHFTKKKQIPGMKYDALIVGEDAAMEFAHRLKEELTQYCFALCNQTPPNLAVMPHLGEITQESLHILVLLSGGLVQSAVHRWLLNSLLDPNLHFHRAMLFVEVQPRWQEAWTQYKEEVSPEDCSVIENIRTAVVLAETLHSGLDVLPTEEERENVPLSAAFIRKLQLRLGSPLEQDVAEEALRQADEPFIPHGNQQVC